MESIETQALVFLLAGDDDVLATLRAQSERATVVRREFTPGGVFVHFQVPGDAGRVTPVALRLGDVWFELLGESDGGEAILWVSDGVMESLELFARSGEWPADARAFKFHYFAGERDIEALRFEWGL